LIVICGLAAQAADLKVPDRVPAGNQVSIATEGSGEGTLYIFGPTHSTKRGVRLGQTIAVDPRDTRDAGRYSAVLKAGGDTIARTFYVVAASAANLNFLAQPSRVPTARPNAISGTAFVFDGFNNLVMAPTPVQFNLSVASASVVRNVVSREGIAWTRMDSARQEGAAQFVASAGTVAVHRVVQQVAAEPCNLRIHAAPDRNGIVAETDPVRDCSGNAVPDGTIVTFTQLDPHGKSTVDAVVKRGIAKAQLPEADHATISVASGVAVGNEIHWGGGR
jgi:hypothetical protein